MKKIARRTNAVILLALVLLGGLGFFVAEYAMNGYKWVMTKGNPHVYNGNNIDCGQVVDKDGVLLLELDNGRVYAATKQIRMATMHWLGDREGNIYAPVIPNYADEMVGYNPVTGIYAYSGQGTVKLTISAKVQMAALEALGDYKGTVAVYNYKTGQILCAVTTPTYDPDAVPDISGAEYEGVYMNRFMQSVYIPGSIFKIVTTAAALEYIPDIQQQTFICTGRVEYGPDAVTCERAHGRLDFKGAMAQSCNCAYASIVAQIGQENLLAYVEKSQVTQPVMFDGGTSASGNCQIQGDAAVELAWTGIGQHKDQINPARFLTYVGAVANGGQGALPYMVESVTCGKTVTYQAQTTLDQRVMDTDVAKTLQEMMRNNVLVKYGDENFQGLSVCAKSGTGQVGGGQKANAMFAGFVQDEDYPLAFIAVVEEGGYGRPVCVPVISQVLAACKEVIDQC